VGAASLLGFSTAVAQTAAAQTGRGTPLAAAPLRSGPASASPYALPATWNGAGALSDPLAAAPAPSKALQEADRSALCIFCRDYWALLKGNVKQVFASPAHWDRRTWRAVGWKALAVVGTMAVLDQNTRESIDNHKSSTTDRIATDFQPFGRQYAALVIGGYLVAGRVLHKPKLKAVAVDAFTTTVIAAGLVTPALKLVAGRSRPREDKGARDFHPFTGGYSFPSGHATAAFSVAASVAQHYRKLWVKGLSYGLASMVAYSRMEKDAHYLSDVTAGAMIGIGVARSVHAFDRGRRTSVAVSPLRDPGAPRPNGLQLSFEVAMR
jgi:membrane-associated phospholipid phosphatase